MDEEFEEWYDQNEKQLLHYARQLTRNPHAAEEVVQNAMIKFLACCENVEPRAWGSYARLCVHSAHADIFRREKKTSNLPDHIMNQRLDDLAEAVADRNELREQLDKCLGKLPTLQRQIIQLVFFEYVTQKAAATITDKWESHITKEKQRAINSLRECLNAYVTGA
jgi:RNA polymerase sigma factor (sigma-70 family)